MAVMERMLRLRLQKTCGSGRARVSVPPGRHEVRGSCTDEVTPTYPASGRSGDTEGHRGRPRRVAGNILGEQAPQGWTTRGPGRCAEQRAAAAVRSWWRPPGIPSASPPAAPRVARRGERPRCRRVAMVSSPLCPVPVVPAAKAKCHDVSGGEAPYDLPRRMIPQDMRILQARATRTVSARVHAGPPHADHCGDFLTISSPLRRGPPLKINTSRSLERICDAWGYRVNALNLGI